MSVGLFLAATVSPALAQETSEASRVYDTAAEFRLIHERLGGAESLGAAISRPYYLGDMLVQYFDRARLERAGRSSSEPLGATRVSDLGRYLARLTGESIRPAFQPVQPAGNGLFFPETEHNIAEPVLTYWRNHGGLERFGPPVSERHSKGSRSIQWFTKAVLEIRVESSDAGRIEIWDMGREYMAFPRYERDQVESVAPLYAIDVDDPAGGLDAPIVYVHQVPDQRLFESQIVGLIQAGYTPVPLARLVRSLTCCATLPEKPIVFTFDDGWESQLTKALPVLVKHRIPATFFVLPGFDVKQPDHMSFDDFRTLADAGMSVQSHTINHAELPSLLRRNLGAAEAEVVESKQILEQFGGVDYLAYPFGAFDPDTEVLVIRANYAAALSTRFRRIHFPADLTRLSRIAVNPSAPASTVIADLNRAK